MSTNIHASDNFIPRAEDNCAPEVKVPLRPGDSHLKEWVDSIDFSSMVSASDLLYLIARKAVEERDKHWQQSISTNIPAIPKSTADKNQLASNYELVNKGVLQLVRNCLTRGTIFHGEILQELDKQTFDIPADHVLMPTKLSDAQHRAFMSGGSPRSHIGAHLPDWIDEGWEEVTKLTPQPFVLPQDQGKRNV